jgi:hypothetical protein
MASLKRLSVIRYAQPCQLGVSVGGVSRRMGAVTPTGGAFVLFDCSHYTLLREYLSILNIIAIDAPFLPAGDVGFHVGRRGQPIAAYLGGPEAPSSSKLAQVSVAEAIEASGFGQGDEFLLLLVFLLFGHKAVSVGDKQRRPHLPRRRTCCGEILANQVGFLIHPVKSASRSRRGVFHLHPSQYTTLLSRRQHLEVSRMLLAQDVGARRVAG